MAATAPATTAENRFLTIKPPPYPASANWMRPAHVPFAVHGPGFERLVTQMDFAGDPHRERDVLFNRGADAGARAGLVVSPAPADLGLEPAASVAVFGIVLG